jgi:uncharacterized FAD-dependent dehydrogenase
LRVSINDETPLLELAEKRLSLPAGMIKSVSIVRQAIDARRKNNISFVYTIDAEIEQKTIPANLAGDADISLVTPPFLSPVVFGERRLKNPPLVVGSGPAGLFAAYTLAKHGYKPILLERGQDVDKRSIDVEKFWSTGKLNLNSNVQFGEGGAGTFSDGKLTTRVNDPGMSEILNILVKAGAPPEIKYKHKPHVGTDKLKEVVKNIRGAIIAAGGEIRFENRMSDILIDNGKISGVIINDKEKMPCEALFLAIGHSARDTYKMLSGKLAIESKAFAIGLRIEHPQDLIDKSQYAAMAGCAKLGAADYALTFKDKTGRAAYSFCMCPGGVVVASASDEHQTVTNGMSFYKRDSGLANSALVVPVGPADFGKDPFDGINYQLKYEKLAFNLGGGTYAAPIQTVGDFLKGKTGSKKFLSKPSYSPQVTLSDLNKCLPEIVADVLKNALVAFGRKIKGFDHPGAVLTGVETRTSSPLRLIRGDDFQSVNISGIYPVGEGAGYAGGIMSAALDGQNAATIFMRTFRP